MIQPEIIYEDESLFVINKPAGWITDSSNTTTNQPVIQKWVSENFEYETNSKEYRNGIVHRLDKETSGILLVAKTISALNELQKEFKDRKVSKTYIALVHGKLEHPNGIINEPVGRLPWRRDRFGVLAGGREAVTEYKRIAEYSMPNMIYSLLELKPKTGRTHQIRIHMKHLGHPLVADDFYAGRKTARHDRWWCPRLFLHSGSIVFVHPISKKEMEFNLDLPEDLQKALATLTKMP